MKKTIFLFFFFFLVGKFSIADDFYLVDTTKFYQLSVRERNLTDSFLTIYHSAKYDTQQIDLIIDMYQEFGTNDVWILYLEHIKSKIDELPESNKQKYYQKFMANYHNDKGYYYNKIGIISEAINNYKQALDYLMKQNIKAGEAAVANNLGQISMQQGSIDDAMEYFEQAMEVWKEMNDLKSLALGLNNMATAYQLQGKFNAALKVLNLAKRHQEVVKDSFGLALTLNNIGDVHNKLGVLDSASHYINRSMQIKINREDYYGVAFSQIGLSENMNKLKRYREALKYAQPAYQTTIKFGFLIVRKAVSRSMYTSYKGLGDWEKALEKYEEFILLRDSISNEENAKAAIKQQMSYEYEKERLEVQKEQEKKDALATAKLKQQEIVIYSSLGGLAVVLILAGFIFKARRESEKLLLNILPESTSKELKSKGKVKPQHYKQATVMFTDFKGFTMLSEQMTPEALVSELDYIFKEFDRIIANYPIEKIKTIGDAYMACGGIPEANDTHALDVVKAALDIKSFMKDYATKRAQENRPYFEVRIGVHTGPLVAGVVGEKKFAYDIWGDTVNTASRMESTGEAGKVNISGETYRFIGQRLPTGQAGLELQAKSLTFTNRGKIQAKNKGEIEMFFVQNLENN